MSAAESGKPSDLEYDVLPRAQRFVPDFGSENFIVRRQDRNGTATLGGRLFKFLNHCASRIGVLLQNDRDPARTHHQLLDLLLLI
jgi:hypothetical protein